MIFEYISELAVRFLEITGYPALSALMALESMIFPIPSELVMPFAGFLIVEGRFSWLGVIAFSTLGTIIGSLISYYIGYFGGHRFIKKFGKYFLLDDAELTWTEQWFNKRGSITIFISRFVPIVRHLISIPAGIGKMKIKKFILYTAAGGMIWNTFLAYLGVILKENWAVVHDYSSQIDIAIVIIFILFLAFIAYRHVKKKNPSMQI